MRVLIAGAGIGGLTAAVACARVGLDAVVLERSATLAEVGAGLQIPPNAAKVLGRLGVLDAVADVAFQPEALEARMGRSGRRLFRIPLGGAASARWGADYYHIHRADYVRVLADAAPDVRLGDGVASFEEDANAVSVRLASGQSLRGDVLIGADGIHSSVRQSLHGDTPARFTGQTAWRAVVPVAELGSHAPDPTACVWIGEGRHAVTYRLRGGALANFVGVVERADWTEEGWSVEGDKAEALSDFAGFHPVVRTLVERAGTLHRWALLDRPPLPFWTRGRVSLLGDAAHPMLPFQASGAAMAVEDAFVLARELAAHGVDGLKSYEQLRLPRTSRVQAASAANGELFHKRGLARQLATYGPMWAVGRLLPGGVRARQDWLYGFDATA